MREHVEVVRRLFAMERVKFHGDFVDLDDEEIDIVHGNRSPKPVPIYIGATGLRMIERADEIADVVVLNCLVPPAYNLHAMGALTAGAERAIRRAEDLERPQLVECSLDAGRSPALDRARELVTQYLGQRPHNHFGGAPIAARRDWQDPDVADGSSRDREGDGARAR